MSSILIDGIKPIKKNSSFIQRSNPGSVNHYKEQSFVGNNIMAHYRYAPPALLFFLIMATFSRVLRLRQVFALNKLRLEI